MKHRRSTVCGGGGGWGREGVGSVLLNVAAGLVGGEPGGHIGAEPLAEIGERDTVGVHLQLLLQILHILLLPPCNK